MPMFPPMKLLHSLFLAITSIASAQDWPQWRGPLFNGSSPEKNLPTEIGPENSVAWSAPMTGPS
ncbi:MAG: hypothetical protein RLZZ253_1264, partial [Verrucomicrobiota bacterium]